MSTVQYVIVTSGIGCLVGGVYVICGLLGTLIGTLKAVHDRLIQIELTLKYPTTPATPGSKVE